MQAAGSMRLDGRTVIVTGGGMGAEGPIGTGAAMGHLFAAHGARVAILDVSPERGNRTSTSIRAAGAMPGTSKRIWETSTPAGGSWIGR